MIVSLSPEWLGRACDLYNREIRGLPHCFAARKREFRRAFATSPQQGRDPVRIGAVHEGRLLGFAFGFVNLEQSVRVAFPGDGLLTGIFCDSDAVGDALVSAVLNHFLSVGVHRVVAFDAGEQHNHLPFFNGGFAACPEGLPVVPQALCRAGFRIATREIQMTYTSTTKAGSPEESYPLSAGSREAGLRRHGNGICPCKMPPGIHARWAAAQPGSLEIEALEGVRSIGRCVGHQMSAFQDHPAAAEHGYIRWLGVEPDYQGRGIGRALLGLMLDRMECLGMRRVFLTTGSQNWRAQPLYCSMGFAVVGTSISMLLNDPHPLTMRRLTVDV